MPDTKHHTDRAFDGMLMDYEVAKKVGVRSKSTIWNWVKAYPDFPRPIRLAPKCTRFRESEIDVWMESRKAAV